MLHHLAGTTIQVANLVIYNCHPQEDGINMNSITIHNVKYFNIFLSASTYVFVLAKSNKEQWF